MNTNNLVNIIEFQDYWRATLSTRSLYFIIQNYFILFFSFKNVYLIKHLHLWVSFFFKTIFPRISTDSKLKLNCLIFIIQLFFVQWVESSFLEIRNKIVLVIFCFLFFLVVLDKLFQAMILIFVNFNKSYIISTCVISLTSFEFAMNK